MVPTLAGSAGSAAFVNGSAAARFYLPEGVAVDGFDNVYVADSHNQAIREISGGMVSTVSSGGSLRIPSGSSCSPGAACRQRPRCSDDPQDWLSSWAHKSRWPESSVLPGFEDGPAGQAQFDQPVGIAIDGSGNIFVGDQQNSTIRRSISGSTVSTLAGAPARPGHVDGAGADARGFAGRRASSRGSRRQRVRV